MKSVWSKTNKYLLSIFVFLFLLNGSSTAHEPLFMMSHEAPGKGAKDVHVALHSERGVDERETEFETEFTVGLTRDIAFKIGLPFISEETYGDNPSAEQGLGNPNFMIKWRFWNHDVLGAKYAIAGMLKTALPLADQGEAFIGSAHPNLLAGLSHGKESLYWYYFVDFRYQTILEKDNVDPGDKIFTDIALGWRPYLHKLEDTDVVLFLELNYLTKVKDKLNGVLRDKTDYQLISIAPEILMSPTNRIMFKAGIQIPLVKLGGDRAEPPASQFVIEFEYRM